MTLVQADVPPARLIKEESIACEPGRICRAITLGLDGFDPIEISLSLPEALPRGGIPVVILLGGFDTGKRSIHEVPKPGANAVIGYDYPLAKADWYEATWPRRLLAARKASRQVPAHLLTLLRWARAQGWSEDARISLLGFSLGALYLPAAHHMARLHHQPLGPSIIAYGGAGLTPIFRNAFRGQPAWLGDALTWLAVLGLRELEPAYHLPHLKGEFLLLNGSDDRLMPMETVERLRALTPEPKTVMTLKSDHMMPGDREVMETILRVSRQWLLERKAINPLADG
ncbi:MAG: hypothetical protein J4G10_06330 [Alphaproteobacteria bacterium]|nr:hypothetical protein [Alphaproteobacteria bacterium]